ncbi:senescence-associated protein 20, partial [Tanacetum coccineum]
NDSYEPLAVVSIGMIVVAEGYHIHENRKTFWVHVWTVENGKTITVTFTHIIISSNVCLASPRSPAECKKAWESKLANNASVPHLLLVV